MNSKSCTNKNRCKSRVYVCVCVCEDGPDGRSGHIVQSAAAKYALPSSATEFFFRRVRKCGQL